MKLRIKYDLKRHWFGRRIMGRYRGKVLYPFMLFAKPRKEVSDELFRHEMEHVYQIMRDGWWGFYIKYLWYAYRYGYIEIPYEVEARKAAPTGLTATERRFKGF